MYCSFLLSMWLICLVFLSRSVVGIFAFLSLTVVELFVFSFSLGGVVCFLPSVWCIVFVSFPRCDGGVFLSFAQCGGAICFFPSISVVGGFCFLPSLHVVGGLFFPFSQCGGFCFPSLSAVC